ncbi:MAG TPA: OsmC family protein [Terriglobales bacterium]|nr:OsmC family protein [Terriglobales bacterium]
MIQASIALTQAAGAGRQFVVTTGSGHHLILDDAVGATGPKPIELVAAALAGCTAFDVINILRKKRQNITAYEVHVEADQCSEAPQIFTQVRIRHIVTGVNIDREAVAGAIHLSESKYCSVGAMIQKTAEFSTSFEIIPAQVADLVAAGVQG